MGAGDALALGHRGRGRQRSRGGGRRIREDRRGDGRSKAEALALGHRGRGRQRSRGGGRRVQFKVMMDRGPRDEVSRGPARGNRWPDDDFVEGPVS